MTQVNEKTEFEKCLPGIFPLIIWAMALVAWAIMWV